MGLLDDKFELDGKQNFTNNLFSILLIMSNKFLYWINYLENLEICLNNFQLYSHFMCVYIC